MPITPSFIERVVMLNLNQGPGLMLDFLGAQAFRVVCVAVKLGLFEALSDGGRQSTALTTGEIARRVEASERGTFLLLDALEALGYVKKESGRFTNTPMTKKWLLGNSPTSMAGGMPFFESMVFDRWDHLEDSIRLGKPVLYGSEWLDQHPGGYRIYEEGMLAIAKIATDEIVSSVKLPPTARRLLDVGGGHGLYSIKFCRRYPDLSATVFDLPPALEVAREAIAAEDMLGRVVVQPGNVWQDDFGGGYDVVLLFNLIHAFSPDENIELLHKISSALNPGGLIVILEQLQGKAIGSTAMTLARLQALNFFNDLDAQTYKFDEIACWLTEAGFIHPRQVNLPKIPGFGLVLGMKSGARSAAASRP